MIDGITKIIKLLGFSYIKLTLKMHAITKIIYCVPVGFNKL